MHLVVGHSLSMELTPIYYGPWVNYYFFTIQPICTDIHCFPPLLFVFVMNRNVVSKCIIALCLAILFHIVVRFLYLV